MSGLEGTSLGGAHLRLHHHQAPQILRPLPNRHFPFSPAPSPATAFDPIFLPDPRGRPPGGGPEKSRIAAPEARAGPAPRQTDPPESKQLNGTKGREPESSEAAVHKVPKEEISDHILPSLSATGAKRLKKPKPPKHKRTVLQNAGATDGSLSNNLAPSSSCRYDSSLGLLTKKFINLLQQAEDGTLDLNRAADILDVQKRRIYDITNVLEGVGLIEKKLKNRIRWKGINMSRPKEQEDQIAALKGDCETLCAEDCRLDGMIRDMQENLRAYSEDENNQKWLFLTKEDINSLPCFEDATLISIKAPHGTSLEVPDPDEGVDFLHRRYQILLRSAMGPIDCYLISNHEERYEASNHGRQPTEMDLCAENSCNIQCGTRSLHPIEGDESRSSEKGQSKPTDSISSASLSSQGSVGGIVKIVPSDLDMDADYWLLSDVGASVTDRWRI